MRTSGPSGPLVWYMEWISLFHCRVPYPAHDRGLPGTRGANLLTRDLCFLLLRM